MKIDKDKLIQIVKESNNRKECFKKLGLHPTSNHGYRILNYYITLYNIDTSHFKSYGNGLLKHTRRITIPLNEILEGKHPFYKLSKLRERLVEANIFEHKCDICKLTTWNNKPIPIDVDHINGISTDHRLDNLRFLCRNCHAQTDNFCGKNIKILNISVKKQKSIKFQKKRQEYLNFEKTKIPLILNSGINFSKFGWVLQVSKIINKKHQKVKHWMMQHMPEFYAEKCFKKIGRGDRLLSDDLRVKAAGFND